MDGQAHTRSELAQLTGWARSTVSSRLDQLIAAGLVEVGGVASSTGGRPPAQVALNPRAGIVLAIDLGATHATVGITDLQARVLNVRHERIDIGRGPTAVLDRCLAVAGDILAGPVGPVGPAPGRARLCGVGIGVPGPVEHTTGQPVSPPIMPGWDRFDIPGYLRCAHDVPVLVDNDVNILALGEHAISWPAVKDLLFVKVGTGIGAGIIAGGRLQRGASGSAGDLGHVRVPWIPGSACDVLKVQPDLEDVAGGVAIARTLTAMGAPAASSDDVVRLVHAGVPEAVAAVRQAGREIGEVLAGVVDVLNPSVIVLGGSVARASEHLLAGVREVVYQRSIPLATQDLAILQSEAGATGGVCGAAILVIQHVLAAERVDEVAARQPQVRAVSR